MKKNVIFAFQGNPLCFIHVLLNSLDMADKGMEGKIILEGEAVTLVQEMRKPDHFLNKLYTKVKEQGLILGACRVCSHKMKATEVLLTEDIPLIGDMAGHPAMAEYMKKGYTIITL